MGDARPFVKSLLPPFLLLLSPSVAAGTGAAERAKEEDEPADITAPIPKISRGFFVSPEPLRLAVRDAAPVPVPAPAPEPAPVSRCCVSRPKGFTQLEKRWCSVCRAKKTKREDTGTTISNTDGHRRLV